MTELSSVGFRPVGRSAAIRNDAVVPYYLSDRKTRISIARVDGRLYAFDDLCTCGGEPYPPSGGLPAGRTVICQRHGSRFDITTDAVVDGRATDGLRFDGRAPVRQHTHELRHGPHAYGP